MKFGANWTNHTFSPGATALELDFGETNGIDTVLGPPNINSNEAFVYIEDEFDLGDRVKLNLGVHASTLMVQDTTYYSLQPRAALNLSTSWRLRVEIVFCKNGPIRKPTYE